jgi:16S rRNA (adenine1518-N6/adenine1519-N6)-dimethyltransferase
VAAAAAARRTEQVTHGRAEVHRLLEDHGLRPSRALGQNFVADANTVRRVVRLAGVGPQDRVVEVGAGLGSLTLALLEAGASVTAVEVDRYLLPVLRSEVEPRGARVVEADALTADWDELADPAQGIWSVVSNLPYNVAVPVVVGVLESAPQVATLLVMVQREVGERLAAGPGSRAYGAVSVKVAYWAEARLVGAVSPQVFVPRPRVESALVRIERRPRPGCPPAGSTENGLSIPSIPSTVPGLGSPDYDRLFAVVRAGFGQRRKMLRRSLLGMVDPTAFEAAGVAPTARAEQLGLDEWCRLAAWSMPVASDDGRVR